MVEMDKHRAEFHLNKHIHVKDFSDIVKGKLVSRTSLLGYYRKTHNPSRHVRHHPEHCHEIGGEMFLLWPGRGIAC